MMTIVPTRIYLPNRYISEKGIGKIAETLYQDMLSISDAARYLKWPVRFRGWWRRGCLGFCKIHEILEKRIFLFRFLGWGRWIQRHVLSVTHQAVIRGTGSTTWMRTSRETLLLVKKLSPLIVARRWWWNSCRRLSRIPGSWRKPIGRSAQWERLIICRLTIKNRWSFWAFAIWRRRVTVVWMIRRTKRPRCINGVFRFKSITTEKVHRARIYRDWLLWWG